MLNSLFMANFVYTPKSGGLKSFFGKIIGLGIPDNVTIKWLGSIGFTSTNDRPMIPILKALEFIDTSGVPTDNYRQYRNSSLSGTIMAKAIKKYYSSLFAVYPNANEKDNEALTNFFRSHTDVGGRALNLMTLTFKALCGLGNFNSDIEIPQQEEEKEVKEKPMAIFTKEKQGKNVTINLNIQITVPETENEEIYDKFFKSMKQNLLDE
jgi:uncharacterized protein DUF5343